MSIYQAHPGHSWHVSRFKDTCYRYILHSGMKLIGYYGYDYTICHNGNDSFIDTGTNDGRRQRVCLAVTFKPR